GAEGLGGRRSPSSPCQSWRLFVAGDLPAQLQSDPSAAPGARHVTPEALRADPPSVPAPATLPQPCLPWLAPSAPDPNLPAPPLPPAHHALPAAAARWHTPA